MDQWRQAEGVWIHKEENSTKLGQFRSFLLLNMEGKIFFSVLSRRMTDVLLNNNYIDSLVEKGGICGLPGCLQHTRVSTQVIREMHEGKGDVVVLWLDFTNAYGSIQNRLVDITLDQNHLPSKIKDLILNYYCNFRLRVLSKKIHQTGSSSKKGL